MMISPIHMAIAVGLFGVKAFTLGILAELRKPESGNPVITDGVVTCKYPHDPTMVLGFASVVSLTISATIGLYSVVYPYKGKNVPLRSLFQSTTLIVFFQIATLVTLFAEVMLLWPTITEHNHLTKNVHRNLKTKCPTAKTGHFGGGAFMALNASLFWLVCLMLANNAREDYFYDDEKEETRQGEYGQVYAVDHESNKQGTISTMSI